MKRDTRSAFRARQAAAERSVDAAVAEVKAAGDARDRELVEAAREREATRQRFTREELLGAVVARDRFGWQRVLSVNTKTITLEGDFGPRRVPFDRVLEFKGGAR